MSNRPPGVSNKAAPYQRFRPTFFYPEFANGTYAADIHGCPWTCEQCWSAYGWRGSEPKMGWLEPHEVVDKLVEGCKRNSQSMARITGGEVGVHWDHLYEVVVDYLNRTRGLSLVIPDFTSDEGEPFGILIETSGAYFDADKLDALDSLGEDSLRVIINFGMKATTPEDLARLTGMTPDTAERMHVTQLDNLVYALKECEHIGVMGSFIDEFTDPEAYANLQRRFEKWLPGSGTNLDVMEFRRFSTKSHYTPKRFRFGMFLDPMPERDEEVLMYLATDDGHFPTPLELLENGALLTDQEAEEVVALETPATGSPEDYADDPAMMIFAAMAEEASELPYGQWSAEGGTGGSSQDEVDRRSS